MKIKQTIKLLLVFKMSFNIYQKIEIKKPAINRSTKYKTRNYSLENLFILSFLKLPPIIPKMGKQFKKLKTLTIAHILGNVHKFKFCLGDAVSVLSRLIKYNFIHTYKC